MNNMNDLYNEIEEKYHIDLMEIANLILKAKIKIIVTALFFMFSMAIYSLTIPNYYKSESILMVSDQADNPSMSGLGGLASMAGINIGGGGLNRSALIEETIKSRFFLINGAL